VSEIDFEWIHAYAKDGGRAYEYVDKKIRQVGRGIETRRPLEIDRALYLKFAKLDGSPAACVEFAQTWGLLTTLALPGAEEPIDLWRDEIKHAKFWLRGLSEASVPLGRAVSFVTHVRVGVEFNSSRETPRLLLTPTNLRDAMLLQLVQAIAGGVVIQVCEQCGEWFTAGGDARRSVAKFCSERCKNRHHYERRTK
jgi:hypothetical protein